MARIRNNQYAGDISLNTIVAARWLSGWYASTSIAFGHAMPRSPGAPVGIGFDCHRPGRRNTWWRYHAQITPRRQRAAHEWFISCLLGARSARRKDYRLRPGAAGGSSALIYFVDAYFLQLVARQQKRPLATLNHAIINDIIIVGRADS